MGPAPSGLSHSRESIHPVSINITPNDHWRPADLQSCHGAFGIYRSRFTRIPTGCDSAHASVLTCSSRSRAPSVAWPPGAQPSENGMKGPNKNSNRRRRNPLASFSIDVPSKEERLEPGGSCCRSTLQPRLYVEKGPFRTVRTAPLIWIRSYHPRTCDGNWGHTQARNLPARLGVKF